MRRHAVAAVLTLSWSAVCAAQTGDRRMTAAEALKRTGDVATVCGLVVETNCDVARRQVRLLLDKTSADGGFEVRLPVADDDSPRTFQQDDQYFRRQLCATGRIERIDKHAAISVDLPERMTIVRSVRTATDQFGEGALSMCTSGLTVPVPIEQVRPSYPVKLRRQRRTGTVIIEGVVLVDGTVGAVRLIRPVQETPQLAEETIKAFKRWRFNPATYRGNPVPVVLRFEMTFSLY